MKVPTAAQRRPSVSYSSIMNQYTSRIFTVHYRFHNSQHTDPFVNPADAVRSESSGNYIIRATCPACRLIPLNILPRSRRLGTSALYLLSSLISDGLFGIRSHTAWNFRLLFGCKPNLTSTQNETQIPSIPCIRHQQNLQGSHGGVWRSESPGF
jgi:hypothetical protein